MDSERKVDVAVDAEANSPIDVPVRMPLNTSTYVEGTTYDLVRDAYDRTIGWTHNLFAHRKVAFLLGRGPSANRQRVEAIREAGIFTMAVNTFQEWTKPDAFVAGDPPHYFCREIWTNTDLMKFTPLHCADLPIPIGSFRSTAEKVRDCANTFFYHQRCNGDWAYFLQTPYVNWGTVSRGPDDNLVKTGLRNSMFPALRILWHLGFRTVGLLGCDWDVNSAHPDPTYYQDLHTMMRDVVPTFDRYGYRVIQANPHAHLRCFDRGPFEAVLEHLKQTAEMPTTGA